MTAKNEMKKVWIKAVVVRFKVLSRNLSRGVRNFRINLTQYAPYPAQYSQRHQRNTIISATV